MYLPKPRELPEKVLQKADTVNLMQIYQKIRALGKMVWNTEKCDCCDERTCSKEEAEEILRVHADWVRYRERVKAILDSRENVAKPYHWKKSLKAELDKKRQKRQEPISG